LREITIVKNAYVSIIKICVGMVFILVVSGTGLGSAPSQFLSLVLAERSLAPIPGTVDPSQSAPELEKRPWSPKEDEAVVKAIFAPETAKMTKKQIAAQLKQNDLVNRSPVAICNRIDLTKIFLKTNPNLSARFTTATTLPPQNPQELSSLEADFLLVHEGVKNIKLNYRANEQTARLASIAPPPLPSKRGIVWSAALDKMVGQIAWKYKLQSWNSIDPNVFRALGRGGVAVNWNSIDPNVFRVLGRGGIATKNRFQIIDRACKILYRMGYFALVISKIKENSYENLPEDYAVSLILDQIIGPIRETIYTQVKKEYKKKMQRKAQRKAEQTAD
jgi:hypothetical protein